MTAEHAGSHTSSVIFLKVLLIDREGSSQVIMIPEVGTVGHQTSDILREKSFRAWANMPTFRLPGCKLFVTEERLFFLICRTNTRLHKIIPKNRPDMKSKSKHCIQCSWNTWLKTTVVFLSLLKDPINHSKDILNKLGAIVKRPQS